MIGFENYTVSAWFDNGLTRHIGAAANKAIDRVTKGLRTTTLVASVVLAAANPVSSYAEPVVMASTISTSVSAPKLGEDGIDATYWQNLKKEVSSWERAPEPTFIYPEDD